MLTKRPTSFLLTPQYRVDALWLNGTGPEVKTEAAQSQSMADADPPAATPTPEFCDLTSGLRRKHVVPGETVAP